MSYVKYLLEREKRLLEAQIYEMKLKGLDLNSLEHANQKSELLRLENSIQTKIKDVEKCLKLL